MGLLMSTKFIQDRGQQRLMGIKKDRNKNVFHIFHFREAYSDFGGYTFRWTLPAGHNKRWSWSKKIQFYFNFPLGMDAAWLLWCRLPGCKLHIQGKVSSPFKQPFSQTLNFWISVCFSPRALRRAWTKDLLLGSDVCQVKAEFMRSHI